MTSAPPQPFNAASFARHTHSAAEQKAEKARVQARTEHWDGELTRLEAHFPQSVVYLYVVGKELQLMNGQYDDLRGLASSFEECCQVAATQITAARGAGNWRAIEAALLQTQPGEPTYEHPIGVRLSDQEVYWFMRWPFVEVATWIKNAAIRP